MPARKSCEREKAYLGEDKAADLSVPLALCPHDKDVGDRGVGDPGLGPREQEPSAAGSFARLGRHARRICARESASVHEDRLLNNTSCDTHRNRGRAR